jgi:hypothetical protein
MLPIKKIPIIASVMGQRIFLRLILANLLHFFLRLMFRFMAG